MARIRRRGPASSTGLCPGMYLGLGSARVQDGRNHRHVQSDLCGPIQSAKFSERYMRTDPGSADRKRKAYVAVAAKIARVAYALIRSGADYRCFPEVAVSSG